jgi:ABC-type multidrug transport system fused ATPase/permease subunit
METNMNARYQTLVILWFALLMSIAMFFLVTLFAAPEIADNASNSTNSVAVIVLTALGTFLVILSFVVKRKLLERSVEKQDVNLVQQALVVACAMCEASALLGLIERFAFSISASYLLFLLAAAGTALHFPKRSHLEAATYKSRNIVS